MVCPCAVVHARLELPLTWINPLTQGPVGYVDTWYLDEQVGAGPDTYGHMGAMARLWYLYLHLLYLE